MVDGPSAPVAGVVETIDPAESHAIGFAGQLPVVAGLVGGRARIWRDGSKVRVDTLDGRPVFRADGERVWQFGADGEPPIVAPARRLRYAGPGKQLLLLQTRPANEWAARNDDFTHPTDRPITTVTYLGRPAWEVELAPPQRKPFPIQLVVDQQTGTVLEVRNDGAAVRSSFVEFAVLDSVDDAIFTHEGPATSIEERDAEIRADAERAQRDRLDWFTANVGPQELTVPATLHLTVSQVNVDGEGTLTASLESGRGMVNGVLARRARTTQPWTLRWSGATRRWSTDEHDWAAVVFGVSLDDESLAVLQRQLHPGVAATSSSYPVDHEQ